MEELKYPYPVGTKIQVICAGYGAMGANELIATVISPVGINASRNGLAHYNNGFYIQPESQEEKPWKVSSDGEYKVLNDYIVDLI